MCELCARCGKRYKCESLEKDSVYLAGCDEYIPPKYWTDKPQPPQPITNGENIRTMSDEELAKTVSQTGCGLCTALGIRELCRINNDMACEDIIWKWLQQPAEEETK